jgi:hypothetical protein
VTISARIEFLAPAGATHLGDDGVDVRRSQESDQIAERIAGHDAPRNELPILLDKIELRTRTNR